MRNLNIKKGYKNRHLDGLPEEKEIVWVITMDGDEEVEMLCQWYPYNKDEYVKGFAPDVGYLGTMRVIQEEYNGIGFNAWEQNNSEFIYYKKVK